MVNTSPRPGVCSPSKWPKNGDTLLTYWAWDVSVDLDEFRLKLRSNMNCTKFTHATSRIGTPIESMYGIYIYFTFYHTMFNQFSGKDTKHGWSNYTKNHDWRPEGTCGKFSPPCINLCSVNLYENAGTGCGKFGSLDFQGPRVKHRWPWGIWYD